MGDSAENPVEGAAKPAGPADPPNPQALCEGHAMSPSLLAAAALRHHPTLPTTPVGELVERWDTEAQHEVVRGPRYDIRYSVMGGGPPLYLIPGMCATQRMFAPLAVELARSFRVVTYELPGVRPGDHCDLARYRLDDYPRDLFFLADHLGDECVGLVANSFGCTIGVRAMHATPARVSRAVMLAGFAHRPLSRLETVIVKMLRHWPGEVGHIPLLHWISRYNHERELELREVGLFQFYTSESTRCTVRGAAYQALAVSNTDVRLIAREVRQPVMMIHGMCDRLVPTKHGAELANRLASVQIRLVPECGHFPHMSHPELVAHATERFFGQSV